MSQSGNIPQYIVSILKPDNIYKDESIFENPLVFDTYKEASAQVRIFLDQGYEVSIGKACVEM